MPTITPTARPIHASAFGGQERLPVRAADVWLFSNIAAFRGSPFCLSLDEGVAFRDVSSLPNPLVNRPVIGVRALRRAGLRVLVDFDADTISVWIPGPWYQTAVRCLRRTLSRRISPDNLWMPDAVS